MVAGLDAELASSYPDGRSEPQPIHTAYVSAALAGVQTTAQWGESALELLGRHEDVLTALDTQGVLPRVSERLASSPVQDLRVDFEDGYGWREDSTEDADARKAGRTLRALSIEANPPAVLGIRIKGLTSLHLRRSVRTLELVLDGASGVPRGFVTTIPKFRALAQVEAALRLFDELERVHGLPHGSLRFELQIESPQAVLGADGTATLAKAIHLGQGRLTALHYGTYDYSAACGIAAEHQSLEHPVADHAKAVMLAAAAQTGVWVCDGSTQVIPDGTLEQQRSALTRHHRLVTRALDRGYWQGWDMHPGHLVTRWLATYGFHRRALAVAGPRIVAYLQRQGGGVIDEPATAQALAAGVLRGLDCGAYSPDDVVAIAPGCDRAVLDQLVQRTTTGDTDQQ
ncbi:aldolase [Mycobacteroides chelonae]|nr:aldolase/citrate lyase family protein [Mycobacteroides chelonae]AKC41435.1 aldolase [Mycobacteroides chelonae]ANA98907.1 aldolase [Mycobacteroides chelonae CCUG 47445]OLT73115.1 aldolase [Mycobacteroides chelonae]ORV12441.1 aldolase [Mycobacteroides chelonae]